MAGFLQRLLSEAFGPSHVWVSIPERKGLQEGRSGVSCPGLGRAPGAVAVVPGDRGQGPPGEGSTRCQHRGGAGAGGPGQPTASLGEETSPVGQGVGAARPAAFAGKGSRSF